MEGKVFEDEFARDFSVATDFFSFLNERRSHSSWVTVPSKALQFRAIEKGTPMGDLLLQLYNAKGNGDLMKDTMENTRLLMNVDGQEIPVRSCAIKTILERARISGHALSKVSADVLSQILNHCMKVASGRSLVKIADSKVSAVHGGDEKDYAILEMLPLFEAVSDFLDREFPGNQFMTAHFDHSMSMAIWELNGQADQLLDAYREEVEMLGIKSPMVTPALRFMSSDVGTSGANLYPILLVGSTRRIVPLGYPIKTEHKNGADYDYFTCQLRLLFSKFRQALEHQIKLMKVEISNPANTLLGVLKQIKAPKKGSYEVLEEFLAAHGEGPCTAYELFLYASEIIFYAQCEGASGSRIAQLEEITARALHVNWEDHDRPGEFCW